MLFNNSYNDTGEKLGGLSSHFETVAMTVLLSAAGLARTLHITMVNSQGVAELEDSALDILSRFLPDDVSKDLARARQ